MWECLSASLLNRNSIKQIKVVHSFVTRCILTYRRWQMGTIYGITEKQHTMKRAFWIFLSLHVWLGEEAEKRMAMAITIMSKNVKYICSSFILLWKKICSTLKCKPKSCHEWVILMIHSYVRHTCLPSFQLSKIYTYLVFNTRTIGHQEYFWFPTTPEELRTTVVILPWPECADSHIGITIILIFWSTIYGSSFSFKKHIFIHM